MVKQWSRDRDEKQPNAILLINEPNFTCTWTKSYQFAKSSKMILEYASKGYFSTPPPNIEKTTRQKSNNIYLPKLHTTLM